MPISTLYVEGGIDRQILSALQNTSGVIFLISNGGSKDVLYSRTVNDRLRDKGVYYFRDRDFDYDVTMMDKVAPITKNGAADGEVIGWRWSRHEIENYLLEPRLLHKVFPDLSLEEIHEGIANAAQNIRHYQAARWTIGVSKRFEQFPQRTALTTRPEEFSGHDFRIPELLAETESLDWALLCAGTFKSKVDSAVGQQVITERFHGYNEAFTVEKCQDVVWVLQHFSGKDLFASMNTSGWFQENNLHNHGHVRAKARDWVVSNPTDALELFPEWQDLVGVFKSTE